MKVYKKKLVSVVIPCYNEEKNINRTFDALLQIAKDHAYDFEFIAVNDGSKDNTWEVIERYAKKYEEIVGVNMMTNYGLSQAYMAGFKQSKGDYVLTLAADLEIPVENIVKVIEKMDEGYDFVNTNRAKRWKGSALKRQLTSGIANKIIAKISGVSMKDTGSGLKGFKRVLIDNLNLYGEMHRFIPAYLSQYTTRMVEFDVTFKDRDYGQSAYASGFSRSIKVLLDLVTLSFMLYFAKKPFYAMPGRLFGATGAVIAGLGGMGTFYMLVLKIMGESIGNRPLFFVSIMMLILGLQSIMMGVLGELMMRTYFESSGRDTFVVREVV
jgi:glycosyltransferase involved in cell wall biosynthesis